MTIHCVFCCAIVIDTVLYCYIIITIVPLYHCVQTQVEASSQALSSNIKAEKVSTNTHYYILLYICTTYYTVLVLYCKDKATYYVLYTILCTIIRLYTSCLWVVYVMRSTYYILNYTTLLYSNIILYTTLYCI